MKRNNLFLSVLSVVVLGGALVGCNDTPPVITHELTLDTTNVKTNYKLGESFEVTGLVAMLAIVGVYPSIVGVVNGPQFPVDQAP